jgi:uncharacterized protein
LIRAVVDPSVFVSAFIGNPNAGPGRLITAWRDRRFVLVVSPLLLDELTDVLGRAKFERWSSQGRASAYIAALRARSELRSDVPSAQRIEVRDPDDHYLVALSREAKVDYLVSVDHDLLDAELDVPVVDPAVFVAGLNDPIKQALDPRRYQPVAPPLSVERWSECDGVFAVGVPSGWRDLTSDELLNQSAVTRARAAMGVCVTTPDPRLGCSATNFTVVDRGLRVADPDAQMMFVDLDQLVQARLQALPDFSSYGAPWRIGLDGERAFVHHLVGSAPGDRFGVERRVALMGAEVWVVHGTTLYIGMFSSPTETYESYLPQLWTMLGSWRWL